MTETSPSAADAYQWCREYAANHQENFVVASRYLLDEATRDAYFALYAFARGADDRSDSYQDLDNHEDARESALAALADWQRLLNRAANGEPVAEPTFVALRDVMQRYQIEKEGFDRMLAAFRQDQNQGRYASWRELREYTRGSADPVGRWVLRVHGYRSAALDRCSDAICTALQLVNFMQDVRWDYETRDRVYLPQDEMARYGVSEAMLTQTPAPPELRLLLQHQARRAEKLFAYGRPLLYNVEPRLKRQLIMFHGGGRLALHALRQARYDVTSQHIRAGRIARSALLLRALRGRPL